MYDLQNIMKTLHVHLSEKFCKKCCCEAFELFMRVTITSLGLETECPAVDSVS